MCEFRKRLSHIHETLPFIRVNVEALIDSLGLLVYWNTILSSSKVKRIQKIDGFTTDIFFLSVLFIVIFFYYYLKSSYKMFPYP